MIENLLIQAAKEIVAEAEKRGAKVERKELTFTNNDAYDYLLNLRKFEERSRRARFRVIERATYSSTSS